MSNALDDKLAGALALAISQRPRANLQQIAGSAGISKATLNRIAPTRKAVIAMLMERATTHLQRRWPRPISPRHRLLKPRAG